jgi:hypothetical protein
MAGTATGSLVQQFASMKATEFGPAIEPKWKLAEKLLGEVRGVASGGDADAPLSDAISG